MSVGRPVVGAFGLLLCFLQSYLKERSPLKGEAAIGWGFTEDEVILPTSKICLFRME